MGEIQDVRERQRAEGREWEREKERIICKRQQIVKEAAFTQTNNNKIQM